MLTGQFMFEIYKINTSRNSWAQVKYDRPILQTLGSRPLYRFD